MKWEKETEDSARAKHTEKVTEILPRFVSSLGQGKTYQTQLLIYYWEKIVGSSIAGHVRPVRMDFRTLFLAADAPVWANELRYMERDLIDKINAFVCEELVKEIKFCSPREKGNVQRCEKEEPLPEKIIPKKGSIFTFELPNGEKVEINGNILSIRPEDRIKKRFKKI